jgi:hypothetical protein
MISTVIALAGLFSTIVFVLLIPHRKIQVLNNSYSCQRSSGMFTVSAGVHFNTLSSNLLMKHIL